MFGRYKGNRREKIPLRYRRETEVVSLPITIRGPVLTQVSRDFSLLADREIFLLPFSRENKEMSVFDLFRL